MSAAVHLAMTTRYVTRHEHTAGSAATPTARAVRLPEPGHHRPPRHRLHHCDAPLGDALAAIPYPHRSTCLPAARRCRGRGRAHGPWNVAGRVPPPAQHRPATSPLWRPSVLAQIPPESQSTTIQRPLPHGPVSAPVICARRGQLGSATAGFSLGRRGVAALPTAPTSTGSGA